MVSRCYRNLAGTRGAVWGLSNKALLPQLTSKYIYMYVDLRVPKNMEVNTNVHTLCIDVFTPLVIAGLERVVLGKNQMEIYDEII